jgi:hypothetical protein
MHVEGDGNVEWNDNCCMFVLWHIIPEGNERGSAESEAWFQALLQGRVPIRVTYRR